VQRYYIIEGVPMGLFAQSSVWRVLQATSNAPTARDQRRRRGLRLFV